jgi:hypothetical protein
MIQSDYLRCQARWCLEVSRECFDLGTSKRLRAKADELLERAAELELAGGARPIELEPLEAALPLGDLPKRRHN